MALSFGAATTDVATSTSAGLQLANGAASLVTVWLKPTTLTAGRCALGFGTAGRLEVHTTTSELVVQHYQFTAPNHRQVTSGLGMVVDEWVFLSFYIPTFNCTNMKVWAGRADTPPVEVTTSVLVAGGTQSVANSNVFIGNRNSTEGSTVAWQGLVDQLQAVWSFPAALIAGATPCLLISDFNAITTAETDMLLKNFVTPAWRGDWPYETRTMFSGGSGSTRAFNTYRWHLGVGGEVAAYTQSLASGEASLTPMTITGTLTADERCPKPWRMVGQAPRRR